MMWGRHKENGFWISKATDWRLMVWKLDVTVYLAAGRFRFRLMKPALPSDHRGTE